MLCLATASVRAEPTAKQVYDSAIADYKAQRFEPAAESFQHAYDLRPQPLLLFNIAQCRRKLGQFAEARAMYRRYIDGAPATEAASTLREAQGYVVEIDAYLAARPAPVAKPTPVPNPIPTPVPTPTPTPVPTVVTASPAASVTLTAQAPPPKRPLRKNPWLWTGVTLGVVAIGLGVGLGVGLTRTHVSSDLGTQSPSL